MLPTPVNLTMLPDRRLRIEWSDGQKRLYTIRELRDHCPCAHCNDARNHPKPQPLLMIIKPEEMQELSIVGMEPIGNYAYGIAFSDHHDTGIYTLDHLKNLGVEE